MDKSFTKEQLLHKAASYCSMCERAPSELKQKLIDWGATLLIADEIIQYLVAENYIDERRYCQAFVRDKFRFNKWGKMKIIAMLRTKVTDSNLITDALNVIDDEEYTQLLTDLLHSKLKSIKYTSNYDKKAKLMRFALSRGFATNEAMRVIEGL